MPRSALVSALVLTLITSVGQAAASDASDNADTDWPRVLDRSEVHRAELTLDQGVVAWTEPNGNAGQASDGPLRILVFDPDDPSVRPHWSNPADAPASHIDAGQRFVVWREGLEVRAYDLERKEEHFLWLSNVEHMHPRLNGDMAGWVDAGSHAGGGRRVFRYDLSQAANRTDMQSWESPVGCAQEAWPSGRWLAIRTGTCLDDKQRAPGDPLAGRRGIFLFDPVTNEVIPVADGAITEWDVAGEWIVWTSPDQNASGDVHVWTYEAATALRRQVASHAAANIRPQVSGEIMVWATPSSPGRHDLLVHNLTTSTTQKARETWSFTAGPTIHEGLLAYADETGRLIVTGLPNASQMIPIAPKDDELEGRPALADALQPLVGIIAVVAVATARAATRKGE